MYLIGKKRCPFCGVMGQRWKENPDVLICPTCQTFFSEFGVIFESNIEKENVIT